MPRVGPYVTTHAEPRWALLHLDGHSRVWRVKVHQCMNPAFRGGALVTFPDNDCPNFDYRRRRLEFVWVKKEMVEILSEEPPRPRVRIATNSSRSESSTEEE